MQDPVPTSDHQEIEWQFDALDLRPVGRWLEGLGADSGPRVSSASRREISDTYLDTDDWHMWRAGYALRIRREGKGKPEATMKLLSPADAEDGLRNRREISENLGDAGSLTASSGPVGERVRFLTGPKGLKPIFEVHTIRSAHSLALDGSEVGEVALDETTIPLEDGKEPATLSRVEVEVDPESLRKVEPFVGRLREECRLASATASKYEAGLFARGLHPPEPPEFGPKHVDASLTTGQVAFAVLRGQYEKYLAHEPGARLGEDPEELHDMRVATRRMRAAIKIFQDALPVRARKFRDELKWVAGSLGEVRDLDVQLGRLETWVSGAAPEDRAPLGALRAIMEEQRAKKRKAMLRVLDSRRYARFSESFGEFLRRGPSRRSRAAGVPILAAAPDLIRKPYRKVRKLGDPLTEESSGAECHELRKKGKRLRYALEFLSDIYGEPAKDLVKPLKNLQDVLGDHQDAEVATAYLRELSVTHGRSPKLPPQAVFVMGGIAERYTVLAREMREEFPAAYEKAKGKRWKKLKRALENARPEDTDPDA